MSLEVEIGVIVKIAGIYFSLAKRCQTNKKVNQIRDAENVILFMYKSRVQTFLLIFHRLEPVCQLKSTNDGREAGNKDLMMLIGVRLTVVKLIFR